jgi:hypothetical protein
MQRNVQKAFDREAELEQAYTIGFFSANEAIRELGDQFVKVMPYALIEGPDVFLRAIQGAARAYKHVHAYAKYEQLRTWTQIGFELFAQDSPEHKHVQLIDHDIQRLTNGLFY